MKIAIRADGGSNMGMGHIIRTVNLAKELAKTNEVFYVCRVDNNLKENELHCSYKSLVSSKYRMGIEKVKSEGFQVEYINEAFIIEELKNIKADLLITDSYDVDENYFHQTKRMFKKTVYIDDMNLYYFDVDILINQNINANELKYKVNDYTELLVGLNYVMLREEFINVPKRIIKDKVENIMVTVGGADPKHLTERILDWVQDIEYTFHVVIGPSFEENNNFKEYESNKVKFYYDANMCEIMLNCDMAISTCGSTLYELAACELPTLGIIIAENQRKIAYKMNTEGIIKNLGWVYKLNRKEFINNIEKIASNYKLRLSMSKAGSNIVDGKGVERLSEAINDIFNS